MPDRSLRLTQFSHPLLKGLSPGAISLFFGLQAMADDLGAVPSDIVMVKAMIYPHMNTNGRIEGFLLNLEASGVIFKYSSEGHDLYQIANWSDFQPGLEPNPDKCFPVPSREDWMSYQTYATMSVGKPRKRQMKRPVVERKIAIPPASAEAPKDLIHESRVPGWSRWLARAMHQSVLSLYKQWGRNVPKTVSIRSKHSRATWIRVFGLMLTRDKRSVAEIIKMLRWCHSDSFWQYNILSPEKLRKQWDSGKLDASIARSHNNVANEDEQPSGAEEQALAAFGPDWRKNVEQLH